MGWNAIVHPALTAAAASSSSSSSGVATLSDANRVLRISIPAAPTYNVLSTETVVLTVPVTAVRTNQRPSNDVAVTIGAVGGSALLNGTVLPTVTEPHLAELDAPRRIPVLLTDDVWHPAIGVTSARTRGSSSRG